MHGTIQTSNNQTNDKPGSLLAAKHFREALDRSDLPASAKIIGGYLINRFNVEKGCAYPSIERIAFETSCGEATVYRALKALGDWFLIGSRVVGGREQNVYFPKWEKADAVNEAFKVRLVEWKEARSTSQNASPRPLKLIGDDLSKRDPIELGDRTIQRTNNTIPDLRSGVSSAKEADATRALRGEDRSRKVETSTDHGKPPSRDHQPKAPYRQSAEAAKHALSQLHNLPFGHEWCGGIDHGSDFKGLSERSERGAKFHWKRLLRSGASADDIVAIAKFFLSRTPEHRRPSIGGFLARFEQYADQLDRETAPADEDETDQAEQFLQDCQHYGVSVDDMIVGRDHIDLDGDDRNVAKQLAPVAEAKRVAIEVEPIATELAPVVEYPQPGNWLEDFYRQEKLRGQARQAAKDDEVRRRAAEREAAAARDRQAWLAELAAAKAHQVPA